MFAGASRGAPYDRRALTLTHTAWEPSCHPPITRPFCPLTPSLARSPSATSLTTPRARTRCSSFSIASSKRSPAAGAVTGVTGATGAAAAGGKPGGPTGASGNKPPTARGGASGSSGSGKGKQALSSVGSGVRKLRNLIASLIWLIAVLAAAVLALGALFTALDQTNQSNEIVRWILERGHDLVGPFKDLFRLETAKNTLLVNWGIAALVYLIAGKIVERIIRP